jgi:hypothetical protein
MVLAGRSSVVQICEAVMLRSVLRPVAALSITLMVGGCYFYPDFGALSPVHHVPVAEVVNQIKCDVVEFLDNYSRIERNVLWLDPGSYVQIQLTLNLTDSGNVNFTKLRVRVSIPAKSSCHLEAVCLPTRFRLSRRRSPKPPQRC